MSNVVLIVGSPSYAKVLADIQDQERNEHDLLACETEGVLVNIVAEDEHEGQLAALPAPIWRIVPLQAGMLTYSPNDLGKRWDMLSMPVSRPCNENELHEQGDISFLTITQSLEQSPRLLATDTNEQSRVSQDDINEFLDQSFALHEQDSAPAGSSPAIDNDAQTAAIPAVVPPQAYCAKVYSAPHLLPLSAIPSASHIMSIAPQTMTCDLIVALITLLPPRDVVIRRTSQTIQLLEVVVGDETRAGFAITFWPSDEDVLSDVRDARSGDVLLLRYVVLGQFRGRVYGQTLRRSSGWQTSVKLLCGHHDDAASFVDEMGAKLGLDEHVRAKVRRVSEWARRFIGSSRMNAGSRGLLTGNDRLNDRLKRDELPPDDTQ